MTIANLRPLSTREIAFNVNRKKQMELISRIPKTPFKKTKAFDSIFEGPIPNFLKYKN
jgi:hypothetical protein